MKHQTMITEPTPVTLAESKRLIELEKTIALSIESFIEVGEALIEIRESKLYRIEYPSRTVSP